MHKKFLKKYYFIDRFNKSNLDNQDKNTAIIFRNYRNNLGIDEIILLRDYCRKKGLKFFLANNIKLSIKLNLDGAYIPSFNKKFSHLNYLYKKNFLLLGSAHNLKEIRIKEKQNVSEIFLSSIFKKNNNFLGINKYNLVSRLTNKSIIALGGISKENIKLIKLTKSKGFAGISFFQSKKKGP
jgi:thiamine-phosphate pyrophosphorylase